MRNILIHHRKNLSYLNSLSTECVWTMPLYHNSELDFGFEYQNPRPETIHPSLIDYKNSISHHPYSFNHLHNFQKKYNFGLLSLYYKKSINNSRFLLRKFSPLFALLYFISYFVHFIYLVLSLNVFQVNNI